MPQVVGPLLPAAVASITLVAAAGCAEDQPVAPVEVVELRPFASSPAPLSHSVDIAVVSREITCTTNTFESRIRCVDGTTGAATTFGREGEGPGEFEGITGLERGPNDQVAAVDFSGGRMTFFRPDGTLVSEARLPPLFQPRALHGDRLFGFKLTALDPFAGPDMPAYVPMMVDLASGEVLWERTDLAATVDRECFNATVGAVTPDGGLVFLACGHELAFLSGRDATRAVVVSPPSYMETFPNERDASEHLEAVRGVGSRGGALPDSARRAIVAQFRATPKEWVLRPFAFGFDHRDRLWVATTLDRDNFSYFDLWVGATHVGMVRVRDRLLSFDIFGATLVTLVERAPHASEWALDWYDINPVHLTGGNP